MKSARQSLTVNLYKCSLLIATVCALAMASSQSVRAQSLTVLHSFTGDTDGANPQTLTFDRVGNLYGTAHGGALGYGTAFKIARRGQGWVFNLLYSFQSSDGAPPSSPLTFGSDGALYGTTSNGGGGGSPDGTVFTLRPPATFCPAISCPWTETVLYRFTGGADSQAPSGPVIFDQSGNLYGTTFGIFVRDGVTSGGGANGAVWELVHSGGSWTINVLHGFTGPPGDGANPAGGVIFDHAGNLFGTTAFGGNQNFGTVFELSPSGSGWSVQVLHNFNTQQGGVLPEAGLVADQLGNFYGITFINGWAFELMPSVGGWTFSDIYQVSGDTESNLTVDARGNLYGASSSGGQSNNGFIFKLTQVNGVWTLTHLYDFTGGNDGGTPLSSVILDANGNIYGTAASGGAFGQGTAWMLTP